jgi:polyisoprenoid-binding protein YceI
MKCLAAMTLIAVYAASAQAEPETYVINSSLTSSQFSFNYLGMATQTHKFEKTSGRIVLDRATNTGMADVTVDATSVNTGHAMLNQQIQSADFFDTANHPAITFKSNKMSLNGDQLNLSGDLTIKGVTKPISLTFSAFQCQPHPVLKVETCGANATVTVKRSDFNMGKYAFIAGNNVTLNLAIGAIKAQPVIQLASRDPM